jgi:hypothetical protein
VELRFDQVMRDSARHRRKPHDLNEILPLSGLAGSHEAIRDWEAKRPPIMPMRPACRAQDAFVAGLFKVAAKKRCLLRRARPDPAFTAEPSNRVFHSYENIVDQPWRIMSIGLRDQAHRF